MKIKNDINIIKILEDSYDIISNIFGIKFHTILFEKDSTIVYCSKNLLNIINEDITDKKLSDIYVRKMPYEEIRKSMLECMFTNNQSYNEIYLDDKIYKIIISPIVDYDEHIKYLLLISYDITINKKIEQEILELKSKILDSEIVKTSFLANISHELKTPMNAILGLSDILLDKVNETHSCNILKNNCFIKSINSNAKYLDELLNNILDYSKLESNIFDILYENFSIDDMFDELYDIFKDINEHKNLKLVKLEFLKNENDIKIISDYLRLKQVLFNLISNSIKFTEKGHIKVYYTLSEEFITFIVEDTGIGISKDKLDIIFDRFYQCDSSSTKKYKGAGLGLSICKSITEILGGKIYVESILGKGSKFYVKIPLEEMQDLQTSDNKNKIEFSGMTIMVIDELPINYSLLGLYLNNLQINIIPEYTGKDAISTYKEKYKQIDLIIIDDNLPDIKANDLIEQLKFINNCKIITKSGKNKKIKKTDYHLKKPINKDKLIIILNELWQK